MRPRSLSGLYWSIKGEVTCADHAPEMSEPRWIAEYWAPIPTNTGRTTIERLQCQHCAKDGRAISRSGQVN